MSRHTILQETSIKNVENTETKQMECSICLEGIVEAANTISTVCHHTFHTTCLAVWRKQNQTCPLCRGVLQRLAATPTPTATPLISRSRSHSRSRYILRQTYLIRMKGYPSDSPANKGVLHQIFEPNERGNTCFVFKIEGHSSYSCFFDNIFDFILL